MRVQNTDDADSWQLVTLAIVLTVLFANLFGSIINYFLI